VTGPRPDGYSVREVLDQVSGKLDGLNGTLASALLTLGNLTTRVEVIERSRAESSSRGWGLAAALLTGGGGAGAAIATIVQNLTH
jgi:hypothetical protein